MHRTGFRSGTRLLAALALLPLSACADEPGASRSPLAPEAMFDVAAVGEIRISDVQGRGHFSPLDGQTVTTAGIVTAVTNNGFYVQDPAGDGDDATSDGIFVFTNANGSKPASGDSVRLVARVSEFVPGGPRTRNLSTTQLSGVNGQALFEVVSRGNPLPDPVVLGEGGRIPPAVHVIGPTEGPVDLQNAAQAAANPFNPGTDGIDFYESLEGMRATAQSPVAVSGTTKYNEVFVLVDGGKHLEPSNARTERGGILVRADADNRGDHNPERVQIQFDRDLYPAEVPAITVGDRLGNVTGVVGYGFGSFEILATEAVELFPGGLQPEATELRGTHDRITVATYNVLGITSLSRDNARRAKLASQIVERLGSPDVLGLQEISVRYAEPNLQALIAAITAAGGPTYAWVDAGPVSDNADSFTRTAFLYNPARVRLVSARVLTPEVLADANASNPDAFYRVRDPLEATFALGGAEFTVINNHFKARGGSSPIFGAVHPFVQDGEERREAQATALNQFVARLLAADKDARVAVLGDLNTFEYTDDLTELLSGGGKPILKNLLWEMPDHNRYTYNFEGNSQVLDHIFATRSLLEGAELDIVHVNVDFPQNGGAVVASDHEPVVARFALRR